ncbi:MAG: cytochrome c oxidase assembly protein [Hyphomicrobiales bacterium]|nr:cytochrome c oxidase assembly protein [Hyphomicrobiales bacterium]
MAAPQQNAKTRRAAFAAFGAAALMLGLSFASVPLYRMFCAVTGYGGTTQRAEVAPTTRGQRVIDVHFVSTVASSLPWRLTPETNSLSVRTGETKTVFFRVTNESDQETAGQAVYNVSPDQAGGFFNKISCFCFSEQRLAPHETAEWPVVFFLDPKLEKEESMNGVETLTLSYTMFPAKTQPKGAALNQTKPNG